MAQEPSVSAANNGARSFIWPEETNNASKLSGVYWLFRESLGRYLWSKQSSLVLFLFLLPFGLIVLIKTLTPSERLNRQQFVSEAEFVFLHVLVPHALLPLSALLMSAGMIQNEVEGQTLTYLLVRPIPRWSIYVCKLFAGTLILALLSTLALGADYLAIHWGLSHWPSSWVKTWLTTAGIHSLGLVAYCAGFGLLSLLVKRGLTVGVIYTIFFEGVLANVPFNVRQGTIMYYLRVLAMRWGDPYQASTRWAIQLIDAPTTTHALAVLLLASFVLIGLASSIVHTREFRMKTPETS